MTIITKDIKQDWQMLPVEAVIVEERLRDINEDHVNAIMRSFKDLGGQLQLQPIVVDQEYRLADGAHRLEAAKRSGWSHVSALVVDGVSEQDRRVIEVEANRLRREFTTLELHKAWQSFYEPEHDRRVKAKLEASGHIAGLSGGRSNKKDASEKVIGNSNNLLEAPVSKATAAKESVGLSIETLEKITDIQHLAVNATDQELRDAAVKGLQSLNRKGASVDPVHKKLLALQQRIKTSQMSKEEAEAKFLNRRLSSLVEQSTGLVLALRDERGAEIVKAASMAQIGMDDLRASRKAITEALTLTMVIEIALTEGNKSESLKRIGSEVSRRLAENAKELLEEGVYDA